MNCLFDVPTVFRVIATLWSYRGLIFLLAVAFGSSDDRLCAQPVWSHRVSLQWLTAQAELIVQGKVASVTPLNPDDENTRFYEISIQSRSVIKGDPPGQVCFFTSNIDEFGSLVTAEHEGLFFLKSSRRDFNRQMYDYFYTRRPWMCQQAYDLSAKNTAAVSFDETGIHEVAHGAAMLSIVKEYARTLERKANVLTYSLREPDRRAFTGYDSFLWVPLDQTLYAVALNWSAKADVHARVGQGVMLNFTPIVSFMTAKSHYANVPQLPTDWQHANTLSVDSLEWMASDCDLIVQGTIADSLLVQKGDPNDDGTSFDPTLDRHLVELDVTDVIKGEAEKTIDFVIENGGKLKQWQAESVPIVVFLRDRKLPIQNKEGLPLMATYGNKRNIPLRYAGRGPDAKTIIAFDAVDHPSQFSASLSWTNDPQKMLKIVREYLARVSVTGELELENSRSMYVRRVESALKGTPWEAREHVGFTFPINEYLEDHARRWVQSPDKLHRWLGAYALAFFRSEQHAEILKDLLDDSGQWQPSVYVSSYTHQRVIYLVRWEAWRALTAWGYDVPTPELGER